MIASSPSRACSGSSAGDPEQGENRTLGIGAEHRVRTGDLRLGNSGSADSRSSTTLPSAPNASILFGTGSVGDPRIFHSAPRNTNLGVQLGSKVPCSLWLR